jgi:hypothetical protein
MKNKFIIILFLLSLTVLKTTAQSGITNKSGRVFNYATNPQVYSNGLIYDIIEKQFWAIQNSRLTEAAKYKEITSSVDIILDSVKKNEKVYNDLTK